MKNIAKILLLIVGLISASAIAQEADSIIIIHHNRTTIIPVPGNGEKTMIEIADTSRIIEIGVSSRNNTDYSIVQRANSAWPSEEKKQRKSKWFSQVEAGFMLGYTETERVYLEHDTIDNSTINITDKFSMNNRKGYQIKLSIYEKENWLNEHFSIISGFKFGYAQTFLQSNRQIIETDTSGNLINSTDVNNNFRVNNFQFLYQLGFSYHFSTWELPARISIGNSLGFIYTTARGKERYTPTTGSLFYTSILQPYLGLEIWKIGVLFSADFNFPENEFYNNYSDLGSSFGVSLTYRLF